MQWVPNQKIETSYFFPFGLGCLFHIWCTLNFIHAWLGFPCFFHVRDLVSHLFSCVFSCVLIFLLRHFPHVLTPHSILTFLLPAPFLCCLAPAFSSLLSISQSRIPGLEIPLCAAQCERIFNTTRTPGEEAGNETVIMNTHYCNIKAQVPVYFSLKTQKISRVESFLCYRMVTIKGGVCVLQKRGVCDSLSHASAVLPILSALIFLFAFPFPSLNCGMLELVCFWLTPIFFCPHMVYVCYFTFSFSFCFLTPLSSYLHPLFFLLAPLCWSYSVVVEVCSSLLFLSIWADVWHLSNPWRTNRYRWSSCFYTADPILPS